MLHIIMWFDPQNQLKKLRSIVPTVLLLIKICCFVLCVQEFSRITRLDLHCGWIYIWIHEDLLAGTCTAVMDRGEVPAPPLLFLDQTWSEGLKSIFWRPPLSYLRIWMLPPPPPPPPPLVSRFDTVLLCCYHHGNSSETVLNVFTSKSGPMYNCRSKLIFSLAEAQR